VPYLTDLDPTLEQAAPRGLEIGDDEIDVAEDPTGTSVTRLPIWIEQPEPGGVSCTTRNASFGQ